MAESVTDLLHVISNLVYDVYVAPAGPFVVWLGQSVPLLDSMEGLVVVPGLHKGREGDE